MNEEELRQFLKYYSANVSDTLINYCVAVNNAFDEIVKKLQEDLPLFEILPENIVRPPEEIKKQIKYEKNPMRLKQLNRELNDSYKVYRKKSKGADR